MNKYIHVAILTLATIALLLPTISLAATDEERADQIEHIEAVAKRLDPLDTGIGPTIEELFDAFGMHLNDRNETLEQQYENDIIRNGIYSDSDVNSWNVIRGSDTYSSLLFIVTYDNVSDITSFLGAGERAGSVASWKAAKLAKGPGNYIPRLQTEWEDVLKIANGRWPSDTLRHEEIEEAKFDEFQTIYQREPNRLNPSDDAAIMTMTYGLRPLPRNLDSEQTAIGFFKGIYNRDPSSTADWDIVRAIAYSGATR